MSACTSDCDDGGLSGPIEAEIVRLLTHRESAGPIVLTGLHMLLECLLTFALRYYPLPLKWRDPRYLGLGVAVRCLSCAMVFAFTFAFVSPFPFAYAGLCDLNNVMQGKVTYLVSSHLEDWKCLR